MLVTVSRMRNSATDSGPCWDIKADSSRCVHHFEFANFLFLLVPKIRRRNVEKSIIFPLAREKQVIIIFQRKSYISWKKKKREKRSWTIIKYFERGRKITEGGARPLNFTWKLVVRNEVFQLYLIIKDRIHRQECFLLSSTTVELLEEEILYDPAFRIIRLVWNRRARYDNGNYNAYTRKCYSLTGSTGYRGYREQV